METYNHIVENYAGIAMGIAVGIGSAIFIVGVIRNEITLSRMAKEREERRGR